MGDAAHDTATSLPTLHASAVLVGTTAVLIRGPSGAGKSRLVLGLIEAAASGRLAFARLVSDDRTEVTAAHGRLVARPPAALAGLLEIRGLGIRRLPWEAQAVVGLIVDLAAEDGDRLPAAASRTANLLGVELPRVAVAAGQDALPIVLGTLTTADAVP